MPILGIDSDKDSAFFTDTLLEYYQQQQLHFTRSRANHKDDQAWIEQKKMRSSDDSSCPLSIRAFTWGENGENVGHLTDISVTRRR
jgi:hypothetical protein